MVNESLLDKMDAAVAEGRIAGWTKESYSQEVFKIIRKERDSLKSGDRILNKNHRRDAKDK